YSWVETENRLFKALAFAAFYGPAIVGARLDDVHFVVALRPMLACIQLAGDRMPSQSLYVAVTIRIHRRTFERVIVWDSAVRVQTQYLACQRIGVLCKFRTPHVARCNVQLAVRAELDPAAVVPGGRRDSVDYDLRFYYLVVPFS